MTAIDHKENDLEQRLRTHYQHHYAPPPTAGEFWTRIQPELDRQERIVSQSISRSSSSKSRSKLRNSRCSSGLVSRIGLLVAKKQNVPMQRQVKTNISESLTESEQTRADSPDFRRSERRPRPLSRRSLEVSIAVLVVASLLLGWFAVTRWRNMQGNGPSLFNYVTQSGEVGYDENWTPDSKHLVFSIHNLDTNQYRYLVWDAVTGKAKQTLTVKLPASVVGKGMLDSLDGQYALIRTNGASSQEWELKLANLLTGKVTLIYQATFQGQNASDRPQAAFSKDSKFIAFIGADQRIYIWDIASSKIIQITDPVILSGASSVGQFAWSGDNKRLMVQSSPATKINPERLQVWSVQSGRTLLNFLDTPAITLVPPYLDLSGGGFAGLSPDGTRLLTYNQQKGVLTERASDTLKVLQTFPIKLGQHDVGYSVFWEVNGTRVLWQDAESVHIWNAHTGRLVLTLSSKDSSQELIVPSSGRYITHGIPGNRLEIWDMLTGTKVRTILLAMKPNWVVWSPDGTYLDVNDDAQHGQLFNALTGKLVSNYQGNSVMLSPDGHFLEIGTNLLFPRGGNLIRYGKEQIVSVP